MSAIGRQACTDYPEKLTIRILPLLFAQAGLDDASAIAGHVPNGFVGSVSISFQLVTAGWTVSDDGRCRVDKRLNCLTNVRRKIVPSFRDANQRRRQVDTLAMSAIRCRFMLIGAQKLQRMCSAGVLAVDAIAMRLVVYAGIAWGFDSRRLQFEDRKSSPCKGVRQHGTRVGFPPPPISRTGDAHRN